jgi:hypothetical protein
MSIQPLAPGDIVYSPGLTAAYEVMSYPLCRLYYDETPDTKYPLQPHSFEYNPNKKQGNYFSYLVRCTGNKQLFYITDHCLKRYYAHQFCTVVEDVESIS